MTFENSFNLKCKMTKNVNMNYLVPVELRHLERIDHIFKNLDLVIPLQEYARFSDAVGKRKFE